MERIHKVHGYDKYDYSLFLDDSFIYKGITEEIPIICNIHGVFPQMLSNHLQGKGCIKCANQYPQTTEEMVEDFKEVHGDKYDYSKVDAKNKDEKGRVCITCPIHGDFWQTPYHHKSGQGCSKCGGSFKKTNDEFIKELEEIYRGKYDLSKVKYVNNKTDVILICPKHGEFKLTPHNILCGGQGCRKCNRSKLEQAMSRFLEENDIEFEEQKKFDWLGNFELDFYLPKYNIAIECQGRQHFQPVKQFGGEEIYKMQLEWDERKRKLCKEHNVNLIYYSSDRVRKQIGGEFPYEVLMTENSLKKLLKI